MNQSLVEKQPVARFETMFSRHNQELRRFLGRYLTNTFDVDDCMQETYLSMWRQETKGHLRENPKGYLFITALNVVRALWRKDKCRRQFAHTELSEHFDLAHSVESEKGLREREGIRLIGNQLGALQPFTRGIFLMHHIEGLKIEEIASQLEISTRTVERHMAQAVNHCRATLGDVVNDILE